MACADAVGAGVVVCDETAMYIIWCGVADFETNGLGDDVEMCIRVCLRVCDLWRACKKKAKR